MKTVYLIAWVSALVLSKIFWHPTLWNQKYVYIRMEAYKVCLLPEIAYPYILDALARFTVFMFNKTKYLGNS